MTISQFARQRGLEPQTVSRYLARHPDIKAHTRKAGKEVHLLPEAEQMLDAVYPVPAPVHVIQGIPHEQYEDVLERLAAVEAKLCEVQDQRLEDQRLIADGQKAALLLEAKESEMADVKAQLAEAQQECQRLRSRSLLGRIFNR